MTSDTIEKIRGEVQKNLPWYVFLQTPICTVVILAWVYGGYHYLPLFTALPEMPSAGDKLMYAIRWQTPSLVMLMGFILYVAAVRVQCSAVDPLKVELYSADLNLARNVLNNTIEQMAVHTGAMLVLATYLEAHQMRLIPILVWLFVTGRVVYFKGYSQSANERIWRVFGFSMTFLPTSVVLLYSCYRLLMG